MASGQSLNSCRCLRWHAGKVNRGRELPQWRGHAAKRPRPIPRVVGERRDRVTGCPQEFMSLALVAAKPLGARAFVAARGDCHHLGVVGWARNLAMVDADVRRSDAVAAGMNPDVSVMDLLRCVRAWPTLAGTRCALVRRPMPAGRSVGVPAKEESGDYRLLLQRVRGPLRSPPPAERAGCPVTSARRCRKESAERSIAGWRPLRPLPAPGIRTR